MREREKERKRERERGERKGERRRGESILNRIWYVPVDNRNKPFTHEEIQEKK